MADPDRLLACRYVSSLSCATKAGVDPEPDNQARQKQPCFAPEDRHKRITASSLELAPAETLVRLVLHIDETFQADKQFTLRVAAHTPDFRAGIASPCLPRGRASTASRQRRGGHSYAYGVQNAGMPSDPQQGSFQPLPQSHRLQHNKCVSPASVEERVGGFAFRTHMTCRICKFGDVICRRSSRKAIPS